LDWQLPIIDASSKQGSLEFNIAGDDVNAFFPVGVSFISEKTFCDIDVSIIILLKKNYTYRSILLIFIFDLGFGSNPY
jgi:hypothetical protein